MARGLYGMDACLVGTVAGFHLYRWKGRWRWTHTRIHGTLTLGSTPMNSTQLTIMYSFWHGVISFWCQYKDECIFNRGMCLMFEHIYQAGRARYLADFHGHHYMATQ